VNDNDNDNDDKGPRQVVIAHGYTMRPDGSIEFHPGVPEHIQREILDEHAAHLDHEAKRRALWGEIGPGAMTRLARMFPGLRDADGVDPWDALRLLEWLCGPAPTSGSTWAALFVLGVWNDLDWNEAAKNELPERECHNCNGIGRVGERDGDRVLRGSSPDSYVRNKYDDDDQIIGQEKVATILCRLCEGKGRYVPCPGHGRFNLFAAMGVWDPAHRAAFAAWIKYPFWP
jgi:hypothetical protein